MSDIDRCPECKGIIHGLLGCACSLSAEGTPWSELDALAGLMSERWESVYTQVRVLPAIWHRSTADEVIRLDREFQCVLRPLQAQLEVGLQQFYMENLFCGLRFTDGQWSVVWFGKNRTRVGNPELGQRFLNYLWSQPAETSAPDKR